MEQADEQHLGESLVMVTGNAVLLDINDGDRSVFAHLTPSAEVKIGKANCPLAPLIGCPFGAVFEVQFVGRKPQLLRLSQDDAAKNSEATNPPVEDAENRNNRDLVDDNTAQTLSADDIENMRREGASGNTIIQALIQNSASFQSKTLYSQEKYKRKKQKKYSPRIITRRPSARSVCDAYFAKNPQKTGFLRSDTLAILLSLANVGAHADILVFDLVGGLLTAAAAERLGGYGTICSTFCSPKAPSIDMVRLFNFDDRTSRSVQRASLAALIAARAAVQANTGTVQAEQPRLGAARLPDSGCLSVIRVPPGEVDASANRDSPHVNIEVQNHVFVPRLDQPCISVNMEVALQVTEGSGVAVESTEKGVDFGSTSCGDNKLVDEPPSVDGIDVEGASDQQSLEPSGEEPGLNVGKDVKDLKIVRKSEQPSARAGRFASQEEVLRWASKGFSCLLIGAPDIDPWFIAQQIFPLLSGSACFSIYHPYLQPLAECLHHLQIERMAVALQLTEPWSREYQVLPSRTHPHMQMSGTGGYILSGIKILNC